MKEAMNISDKAYIYPYKSPKVIKVSHECLISLRAEKYALIHLNFKVIAFLLIFVFILNVIKKPINCFSQS